MGILDGKVAIVTGSGKGLGKFEAYALAREGAAVTCVARTYDDVVATGKEIEEFGGKALPVRCDVRRREEVDAAVQATVDAFGPVDILVNNAQIIPEATPLEGWTEDMMRATWESGLLGSFFFMQACFPYMKNRNGRIINTCSALGYGHVPGYGGYAATKEAIRGMTRQAAREWGKYDILVNCVSPAVQTPGGIKSMDAETEKAVLSMFLLPRWGKAEEEVGRTIVFLSGPDSGFMTGNTISVDGGLAMVV